MDGSETREEKQRCRVWDILFQFGALTIAEIAERVELRKDRVQTLVNHPWFTLHKGSANVAFERGTGRRLVQSVA